MSQSKEEKIKSIIDNMSIEEKAGQLLVVDFAGVTITPHLLKLIREYNCAGLRVQPNARIKGVYHHGALDVDTVYQRSYRAPSGTCKDLAYENDPVRLSASEYATILNKLKKEAMNRKSGIPLHIVFDQEETGFDNFNCGNVRMFPPQMGMSAIKDREIVYKAYKAYAKQLVAAGLNWIHSPVLDVNTNPKNLEVGVRSFSDNHETVAELASIMLKAFKEEKLIATAKHFPGRGESDVDAHLDLPVIDIERERLDSVHAYPYTRLIEMDLPSIMIAHTVYPALEQKPIPATVSYDVITNYLRKELGFKGAITTDNLLMNGLVKNYEIPDAAVKAIQAGATLLLPRAESTLIDEIYHALVQAMKSKELSEEVVDQAIYYNLCVKYEYGLFENGGIVDPAKADEVQYDYEVVSAEALAAQASVVLLRDEEQLLPLKKEQKILLIDQISETQKNMNNLYCHPGILWEMLLEQSEQVGCVETIGSLELDKTTLDRVMNRIEEADIIVAAAYHPHKGKKRNVKLLQEVIKTGKPVIIITNSPYEISSDFKNVLVTFSDSTQSLKAACEILYGKREAIGELTIKNC